jgi:nitrite reductase/ring-hydroxylating ferredoxin subunit
MSTFVCRAEDVPEGEPHSFDAGRVRVCVVRRGDRFYALNDRCPHRQVALSAGTLGGTALPSEVGIVRYGRDGEILRCPWHGWEFDVRTGQSWFDPGQVRVRRYEVAVEPGAALETIEPDMDRLEKGPYIAETYPVSVDKQYVVVSIGA